MSSGRHLLLALFLLLFGAVEPMCADAQEASMSGTDFWVSFLMNEWPSTQCYYIIISSADTCTATIENPWQGWDTTVAVAAGGSNRVRVPGGQSEVPYGQSVGNEAWHVITTAPANVHASNYIMHTHDMSAIFPTALLRCDYMTQTYRGDISGGPEVNIVATQDSTMVGIRLSEEVTQRVNNQTSTLFNAGDTLTVLLMRGQTCRLRSSSSGGFCGTKVHASKPVAVFQGNMLTCIPGLHEYGSHLYPAQDHLYEQCTPLDCWGTRFLVIPTTDRQVDPYDTLGLGAMAAGDIVRVTSRYDGCVVTVGGVAADTLASGESYTFVISDHPATLPSDIPLPHYQSAAMPVSASSPVMVCHYLTSNIFGGSPGDPAVVLVPPVEQRSSATIFPVYNSDCTNRHILNLVTPTYGTEAITLDGQQIGNYFSTADYGFSYARIPVGAGTHIVNGNGTRFQAILYGLGNYESYATVAAMALYNIQYSVNVSRHTVCLGDNVIAVVTHSDEISIRWVIDTATLQHEGDTLQLSFESAGVYRLGVVILPIGDTIWEPITVNPFHSKSHTDSVTICPQEIYSWDGHSFTDEGVYSDTLTTVDGCDSILSLQLSHWPAIIVPYYDTICPLETLYWHGYQLTSTGVCCDTVHTDEGCDSVEVMNLFVRPRPDISIEVEPDCSSYHYSVSASVVIGDTSGVPATISWSSVPPDTSLTHQPWQNIGVSPTMATFYTLTVAGVCLYDTSIFLQPIRWPVARMEVRPERLGINQTELEAYDNSLNADSRVWFADNQFAGSESMLHLVADAMADSLTLTLVAINDACTDTVTRVILVDRSALWAPNIFTPDKPDNNLFAPVLNMCTAEEMFIYNRQGLLIMHVEGANPEWNGVDLNGEPCLQGAYVWLLHYHSDATPDRRETAFGTVTLLR